MLITRKTKIPQHWVFYAQIPFVMSITAGVALGTPFLFMMKKFIDNPAAITFLLSIEVFVTTLGGPFVNWLSDRVWTRFGRRKIFIVLANIPQALLLFAMPFAPDLMTLVILRWFHGIFGDLSSPNQPLTMEVVPAKQRGMGSGFFKLQQQVVNLFVFGLIVGRFDDIYFTGPFENLFAISGEKLIFFAAAFLTLSVAFFTWFGIHEVEPPVHKRIRDEARPGENLVKVFLRGFFKDIFHKSLLPLYLLLLVGTFVTVGLGIFGPLLYTEQWGYSLQEMGTNVALGVPVGIVISLLAGWIADKYSKMLVYTWSLILGLFAQVIWTLYVYLKPDFRPELHEIVLFGTFQSIFGLIAGAVSFPLILEYVERNRLGTAGAGMGLFGATVRSGFSMAVGVYLLMWSIWFLPQAGDRVRVVFREPQVEAQVKALLQKAGVPLDQLHFKPMHRPGVSGDVSRHWQIRRSVKEAGDLHKRLRDLSTELSKARLKLQRPTLSPGDRAGIDADIARLEKEQDQINSRLDLSSGAFESLVRRALADNLAPAGGEVVAVQSRDAGSALTIDMAFVDDVDADITRRSLFEALTFTQPAKRQTVTTELTRVLETVDLDRQIEPGTTESRPLIKVMPLGDQANVIRFVLLRDPDFVSLESALIQGGVSGDKATDFVSSIIPPIRGFATQNSSGYQVVEPRLVLDGASPGLVFGLEFADNVPSISASVVQTRFSMLPGVREARVSGDFPSFHVALDLSSDLLRKKAGDAETAARLARLLPDSEPTDREMIASIIHRINEIAAAPPVSLTSVQPVVASGPADRQYDYFFSIQLFGFLNYFIGLLIIALILRLEKRGVIVRVGALEDANR